MLVNYSHTTTFDSQKFLNIGVLYLLYCQSSINPYLVRVALQQVKSTFCIHLILRRPINYSHVALPPFAIITRTQVGVTLVSIPIVYAMKWLKIRIFDYNVHFTHKLVYFRRRICLNLTAFVCFLRQKIKCTKVEYVEKEQSAFPGIYMMCSPVKQKHIVSIYVHI